MKMEMKKILTIMPLLILIISLTSGCSTKKQKSYDQINVVSLDEQKAIFAATPYIDRLEKLGLGFNLILKDITSEDKNLSLNYYFDDGSGPIIIGVEDGIAKYIIMDGEKNPIEESLTYMEKGA